MPHAKISRRCVSVNSAVPTFASPTRCASRAIVSSNFSGSGAAGKNRPPCTTRGGVASAVIIIFKMGAKGGSDCNCNRSSRNSILESRIGTGRVKAFSNVFKPMWFDAPLGAACVSLRHAETGLCRCWRANERLAIPSHGKFPAQIAGEWRRRQARVLRAARITDRACGPAEKPAARARLRRIRPPWFPRTQH